MLNYREWLDDLTLAPAGKGAYTLSPNGIWIPGGSKPAKTTVVDLFAGCGGFSMGFIEAGCEIVCAVENDFWATITYLANLGQYPMRIHFATPEDEARFEKSLTRARRKAEKAALRTGLKVTGPGFPVSGEYRPTEQTPVRSFIFGDVRHVDGDSIKEVAGIRDLDCIIGGPPCQGFSTGNANRGPTDPRNALVFEFARLIAELQPKTFCMENVPEICTMRTPDGMLVIDQFQKILERGGYQTYDALEKLRAARPNAKIVHRKTGEKRISDAPPKRQGTARGRTAAPKAATETPLLDLMAD